MFDMLAILMYLRVVTRCLLESATHLRSLYGHENIFLFAARGSNKLAK